MTSYWCCVEESNQADFWFGSISDIPPTSYAYQQGHAHPWTVFQISKSLRCRKRPSYSGQNVDLAPHRGGYRVFLKTRDEQRFSLLIDHSRPDDADAKFSALLRLTEALKHFVRVQTEQQTVLHE